MAKSFPRFAFGQARASPVISIMHARARVLVLCRTTFQLDTSRAHPVVPLAENHNALEIGMDVVRTARDMAFNVGRTQSRLTRSAVRFCSSCNSFEVVCWPCVAHGTMPTWEVRALKKLYAVPTRRHQPTHFCRLCEITHNDVKSTQQESWG